MYHTDGAMFRMVYHTDGTMLLCKANDWDSAGLPSSGFVEGFLRNRTYNVRMYTTYLGVRSVTVVGTTATLEGTAQKNPPSVLQH